VKHDGNAESRIFEKKFLDGVGQLSHFTRVAALARVAGPADLSDAVPVLERGASFF